MPDLHHGLHKALALKHTSERGHPPDRGGSTNGKPDVCTTTDSDICGSAVSNDYALLPIGWSTLDQPCAVTMRATVVAVSNRHLASPIRGGDLLDGRGARVGFLPIGVRVGWIIRKYRRRCAAPSSRRTWSGILIAGTEAATPRLPYGPHRATDGAPLRSCRFVARPLKKSRHGQSRHGATRCKPF